MSLSKLLAAVLVPVAGIAVQWFFAWIGYAVDLEVFNAIVAGLVTALVALFGLDGARALLAKFAPKRAGLLE